MWLFSSSREVNTDWCNEVLSWLSGWWSMNISLIFNDMTGQRYDFLFLQFRHPGARRVDVFWYCICDCYLCHVESILIVIIKWWFVEWLLIYEPITDLIWYEREKGMTCSSLRFCCPCACRVDAFWYCRCNHSLCHTEYMTPLYIAGFPITTDKDIMVL